MKIGWFGTDAIFYTQSKHTFQVFQAVQYLSKAYLEHKSFFIDLNLTSLVFVRLLSKCCSYDMSNFFLILSYLFKIEC